jgi:NADH-quinone oxidoreductase subunit G
MAPAIAGLAPRPYAAIPPQEAARAGLKEGRKVRLVIAGRSWTVEVRLDDSLPAGVAAVPAGLAELAGLQLPDWVEIRGEG